MGEGLRWLTVHAACLTYREFIPSSQRPTRAVYSLYSVLHVAILEVRGIEKESSANQKASMNVAS